MKPAFAVWITGLPASGKSTIARALVRELMSRGVDAAVLESDALRQVLTPHPTYSDGERDTFYRSMAYIGSLLVAHGVPVIFDATANRRAYRAAARRGIERFIEVYVDCRLEVCVARDPKGIYRRARSGEASTVPGVQEAYDQPDQSPVTIADFAVQALVAHRLSAAFPDDRLVAEEDAAALRTPAGQPILESVLISVRRAVPELDATRVLDLIDRGRAATAERCWTLDPVDGTQGFVRGDQYVVALALIVHRRVAVGAIGCPALPPTDRRAGHIGWIACAARGRGAWAASLHGEAFSLLHVSACRDPRAARVLRSFEAAHIDLARFNAIVETLGIQSPPVLMDSQAKHALIAAGEADLLIRVPAVSTFRDKIWDQAAGSLIVEEAGGRMTDLNGVPLDFGAGRLLTGNEGVVASNSRIHDAVLAAIQSATLKSFRPH